MPEIKLGNKYLCYSCGVKFYDLGRGEPICPKCGADQNDADQEAAPASAAAKRKRKPEPKPARKVDDELGDDAEEGEIEDLGEDDLDTELDLGDAKPGAEDEDDEDEDEDDEA